MDLKTFARIVAIISGIVTACVAIISLLYCPPLWCDYTPPSWCDYTVTIYGEVVDIDGNPVSGALVTIDGHSDGIMEYDVLLL